MLNITRKKSFFKVKKTRQEENSCRADIISVLFVMSQFSHSAVTLQNIPQSLRFTKTFRLQTADTTCGNVAFCAEHGAGSVFVTLRRDKVYTNRIATSERCVTIGAARLPPQKQGAKVPILRRRLIFITTNGTIMIFSVCSKKLTFIHTEL